MISINVILIINLNSNDNSFNFQINDAKKLPLQRRYIFMIFKLVNKKRLYKPYFFLVHLNSHKKKRWKPTKQTKNHNQTQDQFNLLIDMIIMPTIIEIAR